MNELALFAGAGGGILGGKLLGWRTVCAVEIDPYARSILLARQNDGSLDTFGNLASMGYDAVGGNKKGWPPEPDVGRVADGVAFRMDRLKAIGNGQVPQCAEAAWRMLS